MSSQQEQQQPKKNDSFSFPQIRASSYYMHIQQHTHLQNQQQLEQEKQKERGMHQHHQHQCQHQCYQQQHHQQNLSSAFQSFADSDGICEQLQQMKKPSSIRSETNIIDALRLSSSGNILNAKVADVQPSLDVERELEESYQQYAFFNEGEDDLRQNGNDAQHIDENGTVINFDDNNDVDFSDIEELVPDIAISGNVALHG